jgi:hypothetical protein
MAPLPCCFSLTYYWPPLRGSLSSTACFSTWAHPLPSNWLRPNLFSYKYPNNLIPFILPAYTAYENGTDSVFQNVGIWNRDTGESPKRENITCRTHQKFEIKIYKILKLVKLFISLANWRSVTLHFTGLIVYWYITGASAVLCEVTVLFQL